MKDKLRGENFSRYREVTVVLDENPLIEDPDYIAGMSRMPQYTREDAGSAYTKAEASVISEKKICYSTS